MYTTKTNVENALGRTLSTGEASCFDTVLLPGIQASIDSQTNTTFGSTAEVEVLVEGCGGKRLVIPTMWSVTEVKQDGTLIAASEYTLYPSVKPYLAITNKGTWGTGDYTIKGKLGYETIPGDVVNVATEMAVNYFSGKRDESGAIIKSERVGDYSATFGGGDVSISSASSVILGRYNRLSRSI